jgi:meso-butanediol dehydrogenase / (S,S)-butanediol dehydrogenase / diacetyl reductase
MGCLTNKIALITGAASGIGLKTAERFAEEGASVVLTDKAEQLLEGALASVRRHGGQHQGMVLDVTSEEAWISTVQRIDSTFGRLDILVNNAGYGRFQSIEETSFADWRAILAVNLDSVFLGTKYSLPLLARSGKGSIVNVSSIRGLVAGMGTGAYCASKAGVRLFTKSTALECAAAGNGVRANSVHPGQVETPLSAAALSDPMRRSSTLERIPIGRMGQPVEIAATIVFLASDASSFMTGAELVVDGGYTAQ